MSWLAKRLRRCGAGKTVPYVEVVLADQPYGYWPLNETTGTVAKDASGHARDGAYQGGVQLAKGPLLRSTGARYVFLSGATNAYVDVSAARQFCASGAWSVQCWANVSAYTNAAGADSRYPGTAGVRFIGNTTWTGGSNRQPGLEWGVSNSDSGIDTRWQVFWVRDYQSLNTAKGSAPPVGAAHHFVLSVTSNQAATLYQDGVALTSGSTGTPTVQSMLQIGTIGWTIGPMNGLIGEMALCDRALSAERVTAHYLAGL